MPLTPGARIGPYEIQGSLGAGGMGEVYRARDTRLARSVALKVLPDAFASDPERLARFEREAQTLAALNHPHIAQIHGIEDAGGTHALVMELVEGPTLADRVQLGPIPADEAVAIAGQIADALEAAHEAGIIHRDLKPANVKLRPDGAVKVLDFGLAKVIEGANEAGRSGGAGRAGGEELLNSPTMTSPAKTMQGMILGTAAYMSPEQARGKPVDKRADIWAFGVVLFELLSGRPLFAGESVTDTLARVIEREPQWNLLPESVPPRVRELLARCLVKDPRHRLRDIGDARWMLAAADPTPVQTLPTSRSARRWMVASAALLAALVVAITMLWSRSRPLPQPIIRYSVLPTSDSVLSVLIRPSIALSPDGSTLVFVATTAGVSRLYVRTRDSMESKPLAGTEGATGPVISPDGRWVAFTVSDTSLRKVPLGGGAVVALGVVSEPRGLSWDTNDAITITPRTTEGVFQIPADGGQPREITKLDTAKGERTHRWPQLLPGGRAVLFTVGSLDSADNYDAATIEAVELASNTRRVLITGARAARYVPTGHLLYARESTIYAVAFDVDSLQVRGEAVPILQGVGGDTTTGAIHFSVANDGSLAYLPGSSTLTNRIAWVYRDARVEPLNVPDSLYLDPVLSPDGTRAALSNLAGNASAIWIYDFLRSTFRRLTFSRDSSTAPVWTANGRHIYYLSIDAANGQSKIMRVPADGSREPELIAAFTDALRSNDILPGRASLHWVSGDEQSALVTYRTRDRQADIGIVSIKAPGITPIVATAFDELAPQFTADGRWLAYQSNEAGRYEVFVRDTATSGGRWQVSSNGGEEPHWSADGRELFYRINDRLMVVGISTQPSFSASAPRLVLTGVISQMRLETNQTFTVAPKGDRLLMVRAVNEEFQPRDIRVVINWADELRAKVPAR